MAMKSVSIRIDETTLHKLHYIADYEGRSANGQVNFMIRNLIERFEERHGEIPIGKKESK